MNPAAAAGVVASPDARSCRSGPTRRTSRTACCPSAQEGKRAGREAREKHRSNIAEETGGGQNATTPKPPRATETRSVRVDRPMHAQPVYRARHGSSLLTVPLQHKGMRARADNVTVLPLPLLVSAPASSTHHARGKRFGERKQNSLTTRLERQHWLVHLDPRLSDLDELFVGLLDRGHAEVGQKRPTAQKGAAAVYDNSARGQHGAHLACKPCLQLPTAREGPLRRQRSTVGAAKPPLTKP